MNIIKKTFGIVLLAFIMSVPAANSASAGFFDNSFDWSYDSMYKSVQGLSIKNIETPIQATAVKSISSPASSKTKAKATVRTYTVSVSAYSSSVDETDDSPFITASNSYVRDGIVATNLINPETGKRYAFGTALKIPELYGDRIFVVEDRMNSRYVYNVDIWFPSKAEAKQFGRKTVTVEVIS